MQEAQTDYRQILNDLSSAIREIKFLLLIDIDGNLISKEFPEDDTVKRVLASTEHPNLAAPNGKGVAGIDINPTGIAVTVVYLRR